MSSKSISSEIGRHFSVIGSFSQRLTMASISDRSNNLHVIIVMTMVYSHHGHFMYIQTAKFSVHRKRIIIVYNLDRKFP